MIFNSKTPPEMMDLPQPLKHSIVASCTGMGVLGFALKFLVDVVMYLFMVHEQDRYYVDIWYLYVPQILSTALLMTFYLMFFHKSFYGWFFKLSSVVLIVSSIFFVVLLEFDRRIGYVFYFALVATMNFLNSLYLKCNIIPGRKIGAIEYTPLFFEVTALLCMIISLYSLFCAFPSLKTVATYVYWDYYNVENALVLNVVCEAVMCILFLFCFRNRCEYVYDNMLVESYEFEE